MQYARAGPDNRSALVAMACADHASTAKAGGSNEVSDYQSLKYILLNLY